MSPTAHIHHALDGRTRLRVSDRKGDAAYFAHVEQALATCDGVVGVQVNPLTGSLLLQHDVPFEAIARCAEAEGLFSVRTSPDTAVPVIDRIREGLDGVDRRLQAMTGGGYDLRGLAAVVLLGASAVQVARGRVFGPATSLLSSAASLLARGRGGGPSVPDAPPGDAIGPP